MIQHPIPQNVTGYQFRLIGDMTIKQFVILSVGVGLAIAFYYSNLFFLLRGFFVVGSVMMGFSVAFLPFEERPLDQWLINYLKAIYRPTFYIWRKQPSIPGYFTYSSSVSPRYISDMTEISKIAAIRRQQGLSSYLTTLPQDSNSDLDIQERAATKNFTSLFQLNSPPPTQDNPLPTSTPISHTPTHSVLNIPIPETVSTPIVSPSPKASSSPPPPTQNSIPSTASDTLATKIPTSFAPATISSSLPFPSSPSLPNVIVGMVVDASEKIIPGAIIEVLDESGLPARATKTNQLGQFFSTTPLKRGVYHINIDKPGYQFDTIEVRLTGQIVEPLKIQAKPNPPPDTRN